MKKILVTDHNFKNIGKLTICSCEDKTIYIGINQDRFELANLEKYKIIQDNNSNKEAISQIEEYLSGKRKDFELQIEFLTGTEFQKTVWQGLRDIPYGKNISYKELAQNINYPKAHRAVGNANSKNPIPIIIPCHRVIKSDGGLGGFSCGIEIKKILHSIERQN